MKYIRPERGINSFTCPHCGVLARHYHKSSPPSLDGNYTYSNGHLIALTQCNACESYCVWMNQQMLYPTNGSAPVANEDLPEDVKADYLEAASIAQLSPKGAAALLRLAIQKLCLHLGGEGKNINNDIALLVKNGLSPIVQQSLDIVRVVGNNAVHPGQIDIDEPEVVSSLFVLINVIAEAMISVPKQVENIYSSLPSSALEAIERRDS
ncbi:DUF4145 domain-containing protein [Vibrio parahaemolyticus]|uniref:DUF4145 domain-containing protein n=1 Tax=Vibrio parahaemolyticus TaxID=670 RepID=UPI001D9A3AF8|nr:DUF4145 domain-containing protein [Vibrio parahaemolyticus]EGR2784077.1 DUF4145 domain-containing protein [Vibrio parahaemolyticus]